MARAGRSTRRSIAADLAIDRIASGPSPGYDGLEALVIGLLLMGFAVALAWENKRLLLGESLSVDEERELHEIVRRSRSTRTLHDLQSMFFGPDRALVTVEVTFDGALTPAEFDDEIAALESALRDRNDRIAEAYVEPGTE